MRGVDIGGRLFLEKVLLLGREVRQVRALARDAVLVFVVLAQAALARMRERDGALLAAVPM